MTTSPATLPRAPLACTTPLAHAALLGLFLAFLATPTVRGQTGQGGQGIQLQPADSVFDASVRRPAWAKGAGPVVAIDEAHNNFHTAAGRYRPFATLLANDGLRVRANSARFAAGSLAGVSVLVVASALGPPTPRGPTPPAFTNEEGDAIRAWVEGGGSLFLIADHEPTGAAAKALAARLGVDMSTGRTGDDPHSDWTSGSPTWLVFGVDTGARILDHPITRSPADAIPRSACGASSPSLASPCGGPPEVPPCSRSSRARRTECPTGATSPPADARSSWRSCWGRDAWSSPARQPCSPRRWRPRPGAARDGSGSPGPARTTASSPSTSCAGWRAPSTDRV
ncbi:MAG: hypothetical protein WKG32_16390 [Gemmatimonadaceae bacterium]